MKQPQEQKRLRAWLLFFVVSLASVVQAEDVTVTTYYPSPRGNYQTLNSTDATNLATTTGNVGIGTASPAAKLDVAGTGRFSSSLTANSLTVTGLPSCANKLETNASGQVVCGAAAAVSGIGTQNYVSKWNNLAGTTLGNSQIFDNGTNVGVGTATPTASVALTIANSGTTFPLKVTPSSGVTPAGYILSLVGAGPGTVGIASGFGLSGPPYRVWYNNGSSVYLLDGWRTTLNSGDNSEVTWAPGNIGIGTAGPDAKLHVTGTSHLANGTGDSWFPWIDGNAYVSGSNLIFRSSGNNERMRIDSSGNVGIGTTAPAQKLHVVGNARITNLASCTAIETDPSGNFICGVDDTGGGVVDPTKACGVGNAIQSFDVSQTDATTTCVAVGAGGGVTGAGSLNYVTKWTNSLNPGTLSTTSSIYDNGNVGIGTTSPGAKLDVNGTARLGPNGVYDNWFPFTDNNAYVTGANIYLRGGSPQGWVNVAQVTASPPDMYVNGQRVCRANTVIAGCPSGSGGGVTGSGSINTLPKWTNTANPGNLANSNVSDDGTWVRFGNSLQFAPGGGDAYIGGSSQDGNLFVRDLGGTTRVTLNGAGDPKLDVNGTARLGPNGVYDNWFPFTDNNAYVTGANIYLRGGSPQGWNTAVTIDTAAGTIRGATYGFGGMFYMGPTPATCYTPNPFTGGCSCPAGFSSWHLYWVVGSSFGGVTCPANTLCALRMCYK